MSNSLLKLTMWYFCGKTSVTTVSTKINTVIQWNLFNVDTIGAI